MARLLAALIFVLFVGYSFGQGRDTLLATAYNSNSLSVLHSFFEEWANETKALHDFSKLNDTAKKVYLAFQAFYNPQDIKRGGGSEWGNDIYKNAKYLLVQDKIYFGIVDTLLKYSVDSTWEDDDFKRAKYYDSLTDFRPQTSFSNAQTLVLTQAYNSLLNRFLGNQHHEFASGNIMSPARSKGESEKRKQFLENYIKIWYGHWGGYWQLLSYPSVSQITFDKKFKNAIIDYRMVYEGGVAYLKYMNGKWTLIKAKRTWIE